MEQYTYTNELINESSPYLLQHAHNPVNWQAWSEKAFAQARAENKLVIISIGYAACHWCHVMEHESFENEEVAALMNEHFVCIKVDREERPDVDAVYMNAVQIITGQGGWPLNALALPDGRPFYAGTYFPKKNWMQMLNHFIEMKYNEPGSILAWAEKVSLGLNSINNIPMAENKSSWQAADIDKLFAELLPDIDLQKGGQLGAPKFPMPCNWEFLLQYYYQSKNPDALHALNSTLDNMASGGIYDALAGGFARYSTDEDWRVPHFEKMLYDNAQLISLYAHAYQLNHRTLYEDVIRKTIGFVERELRSPEGAFYSSLDADSEGIEGKYYVWTAKEIDSILGKDTNIFKEYYHISEHGNWEHGLNLLYKNPTVAHTELDANTLDTLNNCKLKLLKAREKREKPRLDDKILTSWNALMLRAYVHAYRALGDEAFLQSAIQNAEFLLKNAIGENNFIFRNYKNGKSNIAGLLDDYAFTISAFIELYQAGFEEKYLHIAKELTSYTLEKFWDAESQLFYYTHEDYSDLISRQKEITDNVIPGSNSEMAKNLFTLGHYFENEEWVGYAEQMLASMRERINKNIYFFANWAQLAIQFSATPYEISFVGKDAKNLRKEWDKNYHPNAIILGTETGSSLALLQEKLAETNESNIFLCRDKVCGLPMKTIAELEKAIDNL